MQGRMQEHKRVGGNMVGNGGEQHGREGWDTADDSTLWKEGWDLKGVGENKEGLEVVSDSRAQERIEHDGGYRTGRRDRTWWLMEEHRKEGWDLVGDGGGWQGGMEHSG